MKKGGGSRAQGRNGPGEKELVRSGELYQKEDPLWGVDQKVWENQNKESGSQFSERKNFLGCPGTRVSGGKKQPVTHTRQGSNPPVLGKRTGIREKRWGEDKLGGPSTAYWQSLWGNKQPKI